MADMPEGNLSIDKDRSKKRSKLFNRFLLPLLSFFCIRKDGNCDEIVNNDSVDCIHSPPSDDQFKLTDLPLLPLLKICEYLRTDGECKDLNNFRYTCRHFARVVNAFLQNSSNLPVLKRVRVGCRHVFSFNLSTVIHNANYVMHPIAADLVSYKPLRYSRTKTYTFATIAYGNQQHFELAAQCLRGAVDMVTVEFGSNRVNYENIRILLKQLDVKLIKFSVRTLTPEFGSDVLAIVRSLNRPKVRIEYGYEKDMHFFPAFITELDSITSGIFISNFYWYNPIFEDLDFWTEWLQQKLSEGCQVRYNGRPFTGEFRFTQYQYFSYVEWHK